jgi:peptide-methionine (R)-S-oxide reductase
VRRRTASVGVADTVLSRICRDVEVGNFTAVGAVGQDMTMKPTDRSYAVDRTEEEWKAALSPDEYQVLRQAGTERPYTGEYTDSKTEGVYACRACGAELFTSQTKFDSHCGWPSFFSPLAGETVELLEDRSLPGRPRTEVRCATCGSHLGHVFEGEGYDTPTDQRFCINSISLTLRPADGAPTT